jgi:alpha,alpha-trehalase
VEKYDVMITGRTGGGGEYPLQDGFGWTNGVMRKLIALYPAYAAAADSKACVDLATAASPGGKYH